MFEIFGDIVEKVVEETSDFIDRPVSKTVEIATQPVRDGLDVLDGLSEGEIRTMAITRLGADVVSGMAIGEVIDMLNNS